MVTEIRIYFEGDDALRPGFHRFFSEIVENARSRKCRFRLIAANGTPAQDYLDGFKANPAACNVLLLDSDEPITGNAMELCAKKGLASHCGSVFWMVQVMESWFLADPASLRTYYGNEFQESALKGNPNVEQIAKSYVVARLKAATKSTRKKEYDKTGHAPDLLASIRPEIVQASSAHCKLLFDTLRAKLADA